MTPCQIGRSSTITVQRSGCFGGQLAALDVSTRVKIATVQQLSSYIPLHGVTIVNGNINGSM